MAGAGYIAVELAGVLQELGSDVTLLIRRDKVIGISFVIFVLFFVNSCNYIVHAGYKLQRYKLQDECLNK